MIPFRLSPRLSLTFAALVGAVCTLAGPLRASSLSTRVSGSGGVIVEAFGQKYPALRTEEAELEVSFDLWRGDTGALTLGLVGQRTKLRRATTRWSGPVTPQAGLSPQGFWSAPLPDSFQTVGTQLGWQHTLTPRWQVILQATPGWRTAGTTRLLSDGFGVTANALAVYAPSERFKVALGAAADSLAEGSDRVLPILGLDWKFAAQWRLSLGLPRTGIFFAPAEALEFGLVAEGGWNTYYVRQKNAAVFPAGRALTDTKLEHQEGRAGLQVNWQISESLQLSLTGGVVGYRRYEYPERQLVLKSRGGDGGYGSLGLTFRY